MLIDHNGKVLKLSSSCAKGDTDRLSLCTTDSVLSM